MVNKYAYGIFGQVIDEEEQVENPFKYVGAFGVMDEGNGTYYMRARYYDPEVGRFISKDPIGLAGGINMYAYAGGNPLNWIDPTGLDWLENLSDFSAGFGDALTFGGTAWIRKHMAENLGYEDPTNRCSGFYRAGNIAGQTWWTAAGSELILMRLEITILSRGNVFKIISRRYKTGLRFDRAHHGKGWGHPHNWWW